VIRIRRISDGFEDLLCPYGAVHGRPLQRQLVLPIQLYLT